jgi:hypothetical protein
MGAPCLGSPGIASPPSTLAAKPAGGGSSGLWAASGAAVGAARWQLRQVAACCPSGSRGGMQTGNDSAAEQPGH